MRNEPLTAYSLHQRPYQDKRSIYYLLTKEHGVLHGIAKKGIPQFAPLSLFATGKKSLKTLQHVAITTNVPTLVGQQQYAALYVNEITLKLLPVEDSVPYIYTQYEQVISKLQQHLDDESLRMVLRHYEVALFEELGFAIDLEQDGEQNAIRAENNYRFIVDEGWMPMDNIHSSNSTKPISQLANFSGVRIIAMRHGINASTLQDWSIIHKQLIDYLFDYKPLQSRILWRQFQKYQ